MQEKKIVINSKVKDSSSKQIFDEPILVAQFVPLFAEERNSDRVKKIRIKDEVPFYMVSLIEHKTDIDYNVREHNEPSVCEADIWRMCANHDSV